MVRWVFWRRSSCLRLLPAPAARIRIRLNPEEWDTPVGRRDEADRDDEED